MAGEAVLGRSLGVGRSRLDKTEHYRMVVGIAVVEGLVADAN